MEHFESENNKSVEHEEMLNSLHEKYGFEIQGERNNESAFRLQLSIDDAIITIRILLNDPSAEVIITNMTTLPTDQTNKGYGTVAVHRILQWAHEHNFTKVLAVQVQSQSADFWTKNEFVLVPGDNPTHDYIYTR